MRAHTAPTTGDFDDLGEGQVIVLLHGMWTSRRFFAPQRPLAESFRLIVPDLPGHGAAAGARAGVGVDGYACFLQALLDHLKIDRCVLAGWSMGALVAFEYLQQFGTDRVSGLVVIDQGASDFRWPNWHLGFADAPGLVELADAIQQDWQAFAAQFLPKLFASPPSDEDRAWMLEELGKVAPASASTLLYDQTLRDYRQAATSFDVPALLTFGRDESLVPVAAGEDLARRIPQPRLELFEASGHAPHLEEPERFNAVVSDFVRGL